jgi:hypothetical protein
MAKRHKFVQRVLVSLFFSRVAASSLIRVRNVDGSTLATMKFQSRARHQLAQQIG